MPIRSLADRVSDFLPVTAAERSALDRLGERERPVKRGTTVVRENEPTGDLFMLKSGMMIVYTLLDDGSRQILRLVFPGDLVGMAVLAYGKAAHSVMAVSDSVAAFIDRTLLAEVAYQHPRVAMALVALDQTERAALTDRLAAVGRTSARARIAATLLDIRNRLRRGDPSIHDSFSLGLTQEEIGDATGLTAVHVNRMLRQLEDQELITRMGGRVTIINEAELKRAANHVDRQEGVDLSWLPA